MKKSAEKKGRKKNEQSPQLDLFMPEESNSEDAQISSNETSSKIFSLSDYRRQQEIKKFYDTANKLTSHLK
jgi:hypothetical protein